MHDLDGRFTKLAFALAASRDLIVGDRNDATRRQQTARARLLPGLAALVKVWLGFVTLGFWL